MTSSRTAEKAYRRGTHRTTSPEVTLGRVRPLMPALGITRLADVTGLDCIGVPVAMAMRPNARSLAVSPGKGLDLVAAKASALMEAVEGWHAERITSPLVLASFNEMRFERPVVDLGNLPRRAGAQLNANQRLLWIEGRVLVKDVPIWVPFELVHTNYTLPLPTSTGALLCSSNGLASGNHPLEAISHGLCEVIERDATTLWHATERTARKRTRVALETVDDDDCRAVLERFERANVLVSVWETTSDIGIAAFRCTIVDGDPSPLRPCLPGVGAGCHPSRNIALLRALTEAAQTRLTLISGARDDLGVAEYTASVDHSARDRILELASSGGEPARDFREINHFESSSLSEDLSWEIQRLSSRDASQVIVVDLTKPQLGIPVFRVIVPGLEGIDEAPGYLGGVRYRAHVARQKESAPP